MNPQEISHLRSFGEVVAFRADRSVDFLRMIEDTIYACCVERDEHNSLAGAALTFAQRIKRLDAPVDADGVILAKLEKGRDALGAAYEAHKEKRQAAVDDPDLDEDDGVVEAYDDLLDALAAAHNAVNELCWALGEHSAEFSPVLEGEFFSAEDLLASLRG
ncbi:hypothetical protein [Burkholderia gladioli]|uniref:hypothetical protein n=1 Tax=Burkholderia gladioli TaxID=28095 RepID=UPI003B987660